MTIFAIYASEPKFPATDQRPDAQRFVVGKVWVDADVQPTQADVDAIIAPDSAALAAGDLKAMNAALLEPGSLVRALGLVMFAEINKLRVKTGDAPYTLNQFKAALQAQMR